MLFLTTLPKNSLSLLKETTSFSKIPIGISKEYDIDGNLVREINYDKDFNFSIVDLIQFSKEKLDIDLNDPLSENTVNRGYDKNFGKYVYIIFQPIDDYKLRCITVDGQTGNIIGDSYNNYSE